MTAPDAPTSDAFLSYHSGDEEWVAALKSALEAKGIRVWLDSEQLRPGDRFPGALARAIGLGAVRRPRALARVGRVQVGRGGIQPRPRARQWALAAAC